jgi:poly(A) polymerase
MTLRPKPSPHARIDAPWLNHPATQQVFQTLEDGGFIARAVGGVVRNALLRRPVTDIDIATDARPADTVRLATARGLKTIPTGLAHGTVTVIAQGVPFEITTLRRDIATDGRHAEVVFTDDWVADAARRDFTVNALYCDRAGTVFDPLGGLSDLAPHVRIRFIGDANRRIAEDYLRILRFFRFSAAFGDDGQLDADGLAACARGRQGLERISGERIQVELLKLMAAPAAVSSLDAMVEHGIWSAIVAVPPHISDLARLIACEGVIARAADPVLRLAAFAVMAPTDALALGQRLKLAARDRDRLHKAPARTAAVHAVLAVRASRALCYTLTAGGYRDGRLLDWARSARPIDDALMKELTQLADTWTPPIFPVNGGDVIEMGVSSGAAVGRHLATLEAEWLAGDFAAPREHLLSRLRALVGAATR